VDPRRSEVLLDQPMTSVAVVRPAPRSAVFFPKTTLTYHLSRTPPCCADRPDIASTFQQLRPRSQRPLEGCMIGGKKFVGPRVELEAGQHVRLS